MASSYFGNEIIYDGIPSSMYGLRIINFDTGKQDSNAGAESNLIQKWILKKSTPYFFGRTQNIFLSINLTLGSQEPIDAKQRGSIEYWLLGKNEYAPLQILQQDMDDITFNVIFTKGANTYAGNLQRSISVQGQANAPWGFSSPNILSKVYSGSAIVSEDFIYYNLSENSDYTYNNISFTTSSIGNSCTLTNHTDDERIFSFTGISALETIIVDNDLGIISSSTNLKRMSNFNKKFFRLIPGENNLTLAGGITNFNMSTIFARKVGS